MSIYNLLQVLGGLAFFLFGMHVMSGSLKRAAGEGLENILQKMTNHPAKGLLFGAVITIAIQSSSALTVMLVGLVNSGIMSLTQTVGVIMGSNIGTTLTAWILSLSGLQTDNVLLSMLKPENFSPILALIGIIMVMAAKKQKKKDIGMVLVGFAVLMYGMEEMSDALSPLAEMPEFTSILTAFENPFLGVLIGAVFTGVIQSSAASVGVLQALSMTGQISYGVAIPIIMGQNIGTCVTALLSSIGVSKNAKRVSVIHVSFNLIGTAIGLVIYFICSLGIQLPILGEAITPFAVAGFHSIFNVVTTILLLPFTKQLVKIAERVISAEDGKEVFLDERLLFTPALATAECKKKTNLIVREACDGFAGALSMLQNYEKEEKTAIKESEMQVDEMVEEANRFLIRLSGEAVSEEDSESIADMLHTLGDAERISDYALNLMSCTKKMHRKDFKNNQKLLELLQPIAEEMTEVLDLTKSVYETGCKETAFLVKDKALLVVDEIKTLKKADLKKLRKGKSAPEASVYLTEYLTVCRRVAEHCMNIAEYVFVSSEA